MLPPVLDTPTALAVLGIVLGAIAHWQAGLSYREYRAIHRVKQATFPTLQRYEPLGFDSFINRKGGHDDAEYLTTQDATLRETVRVLRDGGGSPHLLNSIKERPDGSLSDFHLVWYHDDGTQTEAYLFVTADGVDVYVHHEATSKDAKEHLENTEQQDGDPRGVVRSVIGFT